MRFPLCNVRILCLSPVQPNLHMVLRNLSVKEDLKPYTVDSLFVWEDRALAAAHQVLDEISRGFCQNKEKEEHSKYDDYDKY